MHHVFSRQYNYTKASCLIIFSLAVSPNLQANNLTVGIDQSIQYRNVLDNEIKLNPAGINLSASFELSPKWQLSLDHQKYNDDSLDNKLFETQFDLSTFGAGVSYYANDFSLSLYYSHSKDDFLVLSNRNRQNQQVENSRSSLISASIDYAWERQNWFYDLSLTTQYNSFDNNSELQKELFNQVLQRKSTNVLSENNKGNFTMLSSSALVARSWPLSSARTFVLGALFNWNYQISGNSNLLSTSTRGLNNTSRVRTRTNSNGSGVNNALIGDENYGQVVLYTSLDVNSSWSVDVDITKNIATTKNERSYSLTVSYHF